MIQFVLIVLTAVAAIVAALFLIVAYGARGQRHTGVDSHVLPVEPEETALDRLLHGACQSHAEESGLKVISGDFEAFRIRVELARQAGRSLDLQYYYWKPDVTGQLLIREVIAAADRGVRVRLLLDDINSIGLDSSYLALNTHPMIAVRLFNPSRIRESAWRRGIELLMRYVTATRRMHNKCWIADGRVAVVGGRNIGDAYFGASAGPNFHDLDLAVAGRAVDDAEALFDCYWNSPAALPITSLHRVRRGKLGRLRERVELIARSTPAGTYMDKAFGAESPAVLRTGDLVWAKDVRIIADPPEKAAGKGRGTWINRDIFALAAAARERALFSSPYFIPGAGGMALLADIMERGVTVKVLTNSLAATDVMIVHSAYAKYRLLLLRLGIELYEQKPIAGRRRISLLGSRTASLHTKAIAVDGRTGFVGSFNLDPRSASINTEMGVIFTAPEVALQVEDLLDRQMQASYALRDRNGALYWLQSAQSGDVAPGPEPGATLTRRLGSRILGFLPIESQL